MEVCNNYDHDDEGNGRDIPMIHYLTELYSRPAFSFLMLDVISPTNIRDEAQRQWPGISCQILGFRKLVDKRPNVNENEK